MFVGEKKRQQEKVRNIERDFEEMEGEERVSNYEGRRDYEGSEGKEKLKGGRENENISSAF